MGAGSWGTTVASLAARRTPTTLWARRTELARAIDEDHRNDDYLPGERLSPALRVTSDLREAVSDADVLAIAVPSHGIGDLLATCISPYSRNRTVGEELAKGRTLDEMTHDMHQVAEGVRTAPAVMRLADRYGLELPIARRTSRSPSAVAALAAPSG